MLRWQPGDTVVLRYHNHRGRPTGALPARVVSSDGPVLWVPGGTASKWPGVGNRGVRQLSLEERFTIPWEPLDSAWWGDGVEDELAAALDVGFYTAEEARAFRAEGEAVVAEWPFPTGWEEWEPDPGWPLPTLPPDWDAAV